VIQLRVVGPVRPHVRVRLVCLPYAGGGANVFIGWHRRLPADVEVRSPALPGREGLLHRPPLERMDQYVAALDEAIAGAMDGRPYALFGHSLGALVAYEVAWSRFQAGRQLPVVLIVAGREAPSAHTSQPRIARLPTAEFIRGLARLDGTPRELLANDELMQLLLPALRADFRISEDYRPVKRSRLPVPVVALTGREDREVPPTAAAGWAECTGAGFRVVVLHGGHFFLHSRRDEVLAEITRSLDDAVPPVSARGVTPSA
jgi:medium-chain acyl-[acyl-carrier-protein] hydrolase